MSLSKHFQTWCVVETEQGFGVECVTIADLNAARIVAAHPTEASARLGLQRIELALPLMTKQFEASIQHEIELRNKLVTFLRDAAKPRPEENDGNVRDIA